MPHPATTVAVSAALVFGLAACQQVRTPGFERFNAASAPATSVNPGINDAYLAEDLDPEAWQQRFEVETREIYDARYEIVRALHLQPGMAIADVGAGTGLFLEHFNAAVGPRGQVYALDIAPAFVDHMNQRAHEEQLDSVVALLCSEDSIDLPPNSINLAFICDVYHHFEYPQASMASIYEALRPNGQVVVIDFERIPGVSRQWVLDHVRADKATFTAEIEDAGFELVEEVEIDRFRESYFLRFRKAPERRR